MATPIIQADGSVSGAGTPGISRSDLDIGETISLSDTEAANSGASYAWSFKGAPTGSGATINNAATPTPDFAPDVAGTYNVRAIVNGVEDAVLPVAVRLVKSNARVPDFKERLQFNEGGNTKGWHPALEEALKNHDKLVTPLWNRVVAIDEKYGDTGSSTPRVVGQVEFDPTSFGDPADYTIKFRGVAKNGAGGLTTHCQLYNVSDAEAVATLDFTSLVVVLQEATLTVGAAVGNIKTSSKIYEARIWVDAPGSPSDFIELGSCELEVLTSI